MLICFNASAQRSMQIEKQNIKKNNTSSSFLYSLLKISFTYKT